MEKKENSIIFLLILVFGKLYQNQIIINLSY